MKFQEVIGVAPHILHESCILDRNANRRSRKVLKI